MTNKPKGRTGNRSCVSGTPAIRGGRKPAHLEMVGGKSPRQRIWEKIRELKGFSQRELIRELPGTIHPDTTRTYVKSLLNGGYLGEADGATYKLIKDNGVEAPRVRKDGSEVTMGRAQENIWQTLRRARQPLGARELAALASTDAVPVSFIAVRDYLLNLNNAGYLNKYEGSPNVPDNGDTSAVRGGRKLYQLKPAMNTGPRPPMVQRIAQVFDPNLGKVVWSQGTDIVPDDDSTHSIPGDRTDFVPDDDSTHSIPGNRTDFVTDDDSTHSIPGDRTDFVTDDDSTHSIPGDRTDFVTDDDSTSSIPGGRDE